MFERKNPYLSTAEETVILILNNFSDQFEKINFPYTFSDSLINFNPLADSITNHFFSFLGKTFGFSIVFKNHSLPKDGFLGGTLIFYDILNNHPRNKKTSNYDSNRTNQFIRKYPFSTLEEASNALSMFLAEASLRSSFSPGYLAFVSYIENVCLRQNNTIHTNKLFVLLKKRFNLITDEQLDIFLSSYFLKHIENPDTNTPLTFINSSDHSLSFSVGISILI